MERAVKSAFITGGTDPIGVEICLGLARAGYTVRFTHEDDPERAASLAAASERMGFQMTPMSTNLRDAVATKRAIGQAEEGGGAISAFVHAASAPGSIDSRGKSFAARHEASIGELLVFMRIVEELIPSLRRAQGSAIAISPADAADLPPRAGLRDGLEAYVYSVALAEHRYNVRCNCIDGGTRGFPPTDW